MRSLSLFSGLGAFDLALRPWARPVAGCDADPFVAELYTQRIGAPVIPDVREVDAGVGPVDVICGGAPCQPVSLAGRNGAQNDKRWLWPEFARVIDLLEPQWVFLENVPGLRSRGMVGVLRDLCAMGYTAAWDGIPAAAIGAPHLRDRVWIVATRGERCAFEVVEGKLPRAGRTDCHGTLTPTEPIATVKMCKDALLLPTPLSSMAAQGQGGGELHRVVNHELLPTPMAADASRGSKTYMRGNPTLLGAALLPTPCSRDYKGADMPGRTENPSLGHIARHSLWPTPKGSPSGPDYARVGRERSGGDDLATSVARIDRGPLNPSWVDWLMGLPPGYTDPTIANRDLSIHSWDDEPGPRTLRDVPLRRQRLTALGNALVWQVAREVARRAFSVD